ncbi:MAG: preprotein translocase subunit SecE [Alphaproteobacteria bacterium]|nr:preprotein translocase subunit SecE [Alphaproteobacteria bacterium]
MAKISPAAFLRQVKQEFAKITWPTRQETTQVSVIVIIVCLILAAFFGVVDALSAKIVSIILGA